MFNFVLNGIAGTRKLFCQGKAIIQQLGCWKKNLPTSAGSENKPEKNFPDHLG